MELSEEFFRGIRSGCTIGRTPVAEGDGSSLWRSASVPGIRGDGRRHFILAAAFPRSVSWAPGFCGVCEKGLGDPPLAGLLPCLATMGASILFTHPPSSHPSSLRSSFCAIHPHLQPSPSELLLKRSSRSLPGTRLFSEEFPHFLRVFANSLLQLLVLHIHEMLSYPRRSGG